MYRIVNRHVLWLQAAEKQGVSPDVMHRVFQTCLRAEKKTEPRESDSADLLRQIVLQDLDES